MFDGPSIDSIMIKVGHSIFELVGLVVADADQRSRRLLTQAALVNELPAAAIGPIGPKADDEEDRPDQSQERTRATVKERLPSNPAPENAINTAPKIKQTTPIPRAAMASGCVTFRSSRTEPSSPASVSVGFAYDIDLALWNRHRLDTR